MSIADSEAVLEFWFGPHADDPGTLTARNRRWFGGAADFDREVRERFQDTLGAAAGGRLRRWQLSRRGTLALIVVFDQFSRHVHRGTPQAFACDDRALALCRDAVASGGDRELAIVERAFFYLPLEHAEDIEAQDRAVACYERLHEEAPEALHEFTARTLAHAREHRELIGEFGRFPHRNLALGRTATAAENAWLSANGGRYGQG